MTAKIATNNSVRRNPTTKMQSQLDAWALRIANLARRLAEELWRWSVWITLTLPESDAEYWADFVCQRIEWLDDLLCLESMLASHVAG